MNEDWDDGRVVFYYSREERLKKASPAVRRLNEASPPHRPNLWKTLTATKPLTFLFISMVTLSIAIVLVSRFLHMEKSRTLGDNALAVSVLASGEKSYITLSKKALNGAAYTGPVDVAVSPAAENGGPENPPDGAFPKTPSGESLSGDGPFSVEARRFYFTLEDEEVFRFTAPFTGKKILVLVEAGPDRTLFSITPEK